MGSEMCIRDRTSLETLSLNDIDSDREIPLDFNILSESVSVIDSVSEVVTSFPTVIASVSVIDSVSEIDASSVMASVSAIDSDIETLILFVANLSSLAS